MDPCRIDLAFIRPDDLIGIEIKSGKDTLDRLAKQLEVFDAHLPMVYVAYDPKWDEKIKWGHRLEVRLEPADGGVAAGVYDRGWARSRQWRCYSRMLDILWAGEARAIAERHRLDVGKRSSLGTTLPALAANLTGAQILREVCTELRARPTMVEASDPPIVRVMPTILKPLALTFDA